MGCPRCEWKFSSLLAQARRSIHSDGISLFLVIYYFPDPENNDILESHAFSGTHHRSRDPRAP